MGWLKKIERETRRVVNQVHGERQPEPLRVVLVTTEEQDRQAEEQRRLAQEQEEGGQAEQRRLAEEAEAERRDEAQQSEVNAEDSHTTVSDEKSFEASKFLEVYRNRDTRPTQLHQLLSVTHELIHHDAALRGVSGEAADMFFRKLQANTLLSAGRPELRDAEQLMGIAVRFWTSAEQLDGVQFCSILNAAIRNDKSPALGFAVTIAHAINEFCVTRRNTSIAAVRWPADHKVYRGAALPRECRAFFEAGTVYRAPMFVATSHVEKIATQFMKALPASSPDQVPPYQEPVLWVLHFDGSLPEEQRCVHVNYIDRTDGTVRNEDEMLFAPYSVFTVRSVQWEDDPVVDMYGSRPHVIELDVASDNADAAAGLPLAPWC